MFDGSTIVGVGRGYLSLLCGIPYRLVTLRLLRLRDSLTHLVSVVRADLARGTLDLIRYPLHPLGVRGFSEWIVGSLRSKKRVADVEPGLGGGPETS